VLKTVLIRNNKLLYTPKLADKDVVYWEGIGEIESNEPVSIVSNPSRTEPWSLKYTLNCGEQIDNVFTFNRPQPYMTAFKINLMNPCLCGPDYDIHFGIVVQGKRFDDLKSGFSLTVKDFKTAFGNVVRSKRIWVPPGRGLPFEGDGGD
jgi:hypothetical protein